MPIPNRETIKAGLIKYILQHGGPEHALRPIEIYDGLAEYFALTPTTEHYNANPKHFGKMKFDGPANLLSKKGIFFRLLNRIGVFGNWQNLLMAMFLELRMHRYSKIQISNFSFQRFTTIY